jgi:hypothetical protein
MQLRTSFVRAGVFSVILLLIMTACGSKTTPTPADLATATSQPATQTPPEPTSNEEAVTRPIQITDVQVQIGVGSPIPVEAVASGSWPDLCAQLASVSQRVSGNRFEISLSASPADPACPPDLTGLPFRLSIPLNMVQMPNGTYTVAVNGVETSFDWPTSTSEPIPMENLGLKFTYIGIDGNLWLAEATGGPPRQITNDAASPASGGNVVMYDSPKISSDGRYIAARRDAGVPVTEGIKYQFGLWVYDTETGESRAVYESPDTTPAGMDWKPGTHLLAFGTGAPPNYFTTRGGKPDPTLTTGIFGFDLDSGSAKVLVEPENGYSLILPVWSPDGRFLSFDELIYMEGKGPFAYYNFEAKQYIHWDESLGLYDWSPDDSQLAYDKMTYTPNGLERIFTRPRLDGSEVQISPEPAQGYAFYPVYSPDGQQVAYLTNPGGPDSTQYTLVVQDLPNGEPRELGIYELIWNLDWSSDGKALIFSAGQHEAQQIYGYDLASRTTTVLAQGSQPSLAKP